MAPGDLERALCGLAFPTDGNVLVGLERADDAGVYRINDDLALIQTVDFFTPIVDDPFAFGQIAAANALSDIYAMGGVPKTALNLVAFPAKSMEISILRRIIEGGIDILRLAGVALIGGHSVEDPELKYGLAVTGFIHPQRILTKAGLRPGDRLILTKPLGSGIINTAVKAGLADEATVDRVTRIMAALNRTAAEVMSAYKVHACTDITGFGLLGHLAEMVVDSEVGVQLDTADLPLLPETLAFAAMGLIPAGAYKNREFRQSAVSVAHSVDRAVVDALYDPQTSGGLLIGVDAKDAAALLENLRSRNIDDAAIIGEVTTDHRGAIHVR